jgi:hypothetical protein
MKDALGHGSNGVGAQLRQRIDADRHMFGGPRPTLLRDNTSNAQAARSLMGSLKSTMVPVHDSMAGRASNPTSQRGPTDLGNRIKSAVGRGSNSEDRAAFAAWNGLK